MPSTWRTAAVTTAAVALTVAGFVRTDEQAPPPAAPAATQPSATAAAAPVRGIDAIHEMYLDHGPDAGVMVIAHRGYWRGAPENSIAAIEQAIERGAHVVEIDVQRTADGHLVLMHDTTVDRTTNGTGAVSSLTLAQIKALRLKEHLGGAQAALTDHQVPTLEEALAVVKDRAMVNLDKGWPFRDQEYELLVRTGTLRNAIFKSSAIVVCWIRGGEWIRYSVDVRVPGRYAVTARVSSPYRPAGRFTVEVDDGVTLGPVDVRTTTGHNTFMTQPVGEIVLDRGTHHVTVQVDPDAYQNFNLDWLELDRIGSR
ncbi:glycerophosphodiester phosphodiesterase family protein [Jiangella rhizosphaerae]|uniref:Glycerophosphodiester phosphodiesterase n=1 Tax=Jiangella rhizosphaerae TaxID=2293569 RepID=A0A418KU43_9ACTN|nr:glycerophosphodiester phosphodiesterase family protein [Jiangella rhizosphaerae]RIQ31140.1 hypothetical protein DY240_06145 [Jiangella rhizosphaerae]